MSQKLELQDHIANHWARFLDLLKATRADIALERSLHALASVATDASRSVVFPEDAAAPLAIDATELAPPAPPAASCERDVLSLVSPARLDAIVMSLEHLASASRHLNRVHLLQRRDCAMGGPGSDPRFATPRNGHACCRLRRATATL